MHTSKNSQQRSGTPRAESPDPADLAALDDLLGLAELCIAYLDREQAHLEPAREVLRKVYAAALTGRPGELADALQGQEHLARLALNLNQERLQLQERGARLLGIPRDSVTVEALARRLPAGLAQALLERRHLLRPLAADVQKLSRDLALFGHYFLDFLRRFFVQLTGGRNSERYGPEGRRRDPVCGSLLKAQG